MSSFESLFYPQSNIKPFLSRFNKDIAPLLAVPISSVSEETTESKHCTARGFAQKSAISSSLESKTTTILEEVTLQ